MSKLQGQWQSCAKLRSQSYTCGHCGNALASIEGYYTAAIGGSQTATVYICHFCNRPTYIEYDGGTQIPAVAMGNPVKHLPTDVNGLYEEARRCTSAGAFTASAMCCRKLLMNVAVTKGARPGGSFVSYVDFLDAQKLVPQGSKDWIDHIREMGNDAAHEVTQTRPDDASELLSFTEMMLKLIYEFPARMQTKKSGSGGN